MDKDSKQDYLDKLKRFLSTPHSSKSYFDVYQQDHQDAEFDSYTKKLENLLDQLDNDQLDQAAFCKEIKSLKLPHNQFGCEK